LSPKQVSQRIGKSVLSDVDDAMLELEEEEDAGTMVLGGGAIQTDSLGQDLTKAPKLG